MIAMATLPIEATPLRLKLIASSESKSKLSIFQYWSQFDLHLGLVDVRRCEHLVSLLLIIMN